MGAVDLVIQVESRSRSHAACSASGERRHLEVQFHEARIFPKFRADLLESAVVARACAGCNRRRLASRNPLDVLAQQIVAVCADEEVSVDDLHSSSVAYPFCDLSRAQLENVLDMLAGRYPSDEFAGSARASFGIERQGSCAGAPAQAAPSPTGTIPDAGSSACISWTAAARSASSTRRWCTRPERVRRFSSAPRPGGSGHHVTVSWFPLRPACPGSLLSGKERGRSAG